MFEGVFELADVSGPRITAKQIDGFGGDMAGRDAFLEADLFHEVLGEEGNVLEAVAERGQSQRHHVEAVIQIFAEAAGGDALRQVGVGGGDHADVDVNGFRGADALELALLEDAQELGLRIQGHVADFIEEERAVVGLFETAGAGLNGSSEGSADVPEQLGFEQGFGQGGAIDGDHGEVGARAGQVDGAGGGLLSGSGFAGDKDGGAFRADEADFFGEALDGGATADEGAAPGFSEGKNRLRGRHSIVSRGEIGGVGGEENREVFLGEVEEGRG